MAERPSSHSWVILLLLTHCSPAPLSLLKPEAAALSNTSFLTLPTLPELRKSLPAALLSQYDQVLTPLFESYLASLDSFITSFELIQLPLSYTNLTAVPSPPPNTVVPGSEGIKPASQAGVYIRQIILGFNLCSFETVAKLYESCKAYVSAGDGADGANGAGVGATPLLSHRPVSFLTSTIQSKCLSLATDLGKTSSSFDRTQAQLANLQEYHPSHPLPHFMSYLNHLHHNSFPQALDSLHRYFDYTHSQSTSHPIQYSLTALSYLHHHFGHQSLSLLATEESIRVAHQSNDPSCVAYALAWLRANSSSLSDGYNERTEDLLKRGYFRAAESNLDHLTRTSRLAMAAYETQVCPHRPEKSLPMLSDDNPGNYDVGEVRQLNAKSRLVESAIWESAGHNTLAKLHATAAHKHNSEDITADDRALAVCKEACALLNGFDETESRSSTYTQALWHLHDSFYKTHPNPVSTLFPHTYVEILMSSLISRGQLDDAASLLPLLLSVSPLHRHGAGLPQHVSSMMSAVKLLTRQGRLEQALDINDRMCGLCDRSKLRVQHANLLLQRAEVFMESEGGEVRAIQPLMRCLGVCEAAGMGTLHAVALLVLGGINLRLGEWRRAERLVSENMGKILEHADVEKQGDAWMVLAKCQLSRMGEGEEGAPAAVALKECARFLRLGLETYERCDCVRGRTEATYLRSMVESLGEGGEQEECAEEFGRLEAQRMEGAAYCFVSS